MVPPLNNAVVETLYCIYPIRSGSFEREGVNHKYKWESIAPKYRSILWYWLVLIAFWIPIPKYD